MDARAVVVVVAGGFVVSEEKILEIQLILICSLKREKTIIMSTLHGLVQLCSLRLLLLFLSPNLIDGRL